MYSEKSKETKIFYTWRAIIVYILFSGGGLFLSIFLVLRLNLPHLIGWTAFLIFFIGPIIFSPFWKRIFTRKAKIDFFDDYFSISIFDKNTGLLDRQMEYRFDDIEYFKMIESANQDTTVLKLFFRKGGKIIYTFLDQKDDRENSIVANINKSIQTYNLKQNENKQITFAPSLFATNAGTYYILSLTMLLAIALTLQIIYKPKTIPISLILAIFIYLQIFAQRKKDKESLQKMKKDNKAM